MINRIGLLFIICVLPLVISAQTYELTTSTSPYTNLVGGIPAVTDYWDDPGYDVPIGFIFHFYNQNITTVHQIETVAYALLSTSNSADTLGFFFVFGADLIDRGYQDTTLESPITYKTTGSPGQRIFTIEWKNAGFYRQYFFTGSNSDFVNFQMRLYESDGSIEYHFGPSNITHPELDYDSTGAFTGLIEKLVLETDVSYGEALLLTGNPSNPTVVNAYQTVFLNGTIPANTVYRFSRQVTAVDDPLADADKPFFSPNPCNDYIQVNDWAQGDIVPPVLIYNSAGSLVRVEKQPGSIETLGLPPGIYQLQFHTAKGLHSQRITVMH